LKFSESHQEPETAFSQTSVTYNTYNNIRRRWKCQ